MTTWTNLLNNMDVCVYALYDRTGPSVTPNEIHTMSSSAACFETNGTAALGEDLATKMREWGTKCRGEGGRDAATFLCAPWARELHLLMTL
jgi:hypothetical protein